MIQRIQTIYLLLTIVIMFLFLPGNIIEFTVKHQTAFTITGTGAYKVAEGNKIMLTERFLFMPAVSAIVPLIFLAAIFLYKHRKVQLRVILTGIFLIIVMLVSLVFVSMDIVNNNNAEIVPTIKMIYPLVMILFAFLAYRAVQKDEHRVKSYERLR